MRILALDTCFDAVSAAVGVRDAGGAWHVAERFEAMGKGHAEMVLPMVRAVMAEAGIGFADLDRIAVTNGPGGFTGLRAGLAAARGLALAAHKPLVALGSLELMALAAARSVPSALRSMPLVIAQDARKGDVFWQAFKSAVAPEKVGASLLLGAATAAASLSPMACIIAGSGARAVRDAARRADIHTIDTLSAHARDLAVAAADRPVEGAVAPIYLRPPDAKPQLEARIARSGQ